MASVVAMLVVFLAGATTSSARRDWRGAARCAMARCPTNVFAVTAETLWSCQATSLLAAVNLDSCSIRRRGVPALFPWDSAYNTFRLNVDLQQQRQPLFIVRPRRACDVVRTIGLARRHDLSVSVRSGGHCNEPYSIYNPIVIAISSLSDSVSFDEAAGVLTCDGGMTQGQLFAAVSRINKRSPRSWCFPLAHRRPSTDDDDLGTTTGTASDVGLSGIVSAGGVGFLQRKLGLTIDSVRSLTVALADGRLVTATARNRHADLFAAMRGSGGGNYGIITRLQLQLHPIDGGLLTFKLTWTDWSQAATILALWQSLAPNYPDELTQQLYFAIADGASTPTVASAGVFVGTDVQSLRTLLLPLTSLPTAQLTVRATDFEGETRQFASGRAYAPFGYRRTQFAFQPLTDSAISTLVEQFELAVGIPGTHTIEFDPFGGQVRRAPLTSSAFYARGAQFWLLFATVWRDQADQPANWAWSSTIFNVMRPLTSNFCYTGFVMADLPDFLDSYYGTLLPSLQATKTKYDPSNFFRFPQSIPPI